MQFHSWTWTIFFGFFNSEWNVMDREMLVTVAQRHWEMWLPKKTRKLKAAGQFETVIQTAVARASAEIAVLLNRGCQAREAEDITLRKYVCLKPEPQEED
jgi:hypothetical protein